MKLAAQPSVAGDRRVVARGAKVGRSLSRALAALGPRKGRAGSCPHHSNGHLATTCIILVSTDPGHYHSASRP